MVHFFLKNLHVESIKIYISFSVTPPAKVVEPPQEEVEILGVKTGRAKKKETPKTSNVTDVDGEK